MAKTLSQAKRKLHKTEVVHHGEAITLPEKMTIPQAMEVLERRAEFLEAEVRIDRTYKCAFDDGAVAVSRYLTDRYGLAEGLATASFFGTRPPEMLDIPVGVNEIEQCVVGKMALPFDTDGEMHVLNRSGKLVIAIFTRNKYADDAKSLLDGVTAQLQKASIYRGKAIRVAFTDDDGNKLTSPHVEFMDVSGVTRDSAIYSRSVEEEISANLYSKIERREDYAVNGQPFRFGLLLSGDYGTGKTLAGRVTAALCEQNGVAFQYVAKASDLPHAIAFAEEYQPCVVYAEDIDRETKRVAGDERSDSLNTIMNCLDGVDNKGMDVMVVLTTNHADAISPGMMRPGRIDQEVIVSPPDAEAVERLVAMYGGDAVANTPLKEVGIALEGIMPAVIGEIVSRAIRWEIDRSEPGSKVSELSVEALLGSAESFAKQRERIMTQTPQEPDTLSNALANVVSSVVDARLDERPFEVDHRRLQEVHANVV